MHRLLPFFVVLLSAALAGCATADKLLFKGLAGEAPGEYRPAPPAIAEGALAKPPPPIGSTQFKPIPPTPSAATDSETGRKIASLRTEFIGLQNQIAQYGDELNLFRRSLRLNLDEYRKATAALRLTDVRLPDNTPQFAAAVADARSKLGRVNADLLRMNGLASKVTVSAAYMGELREQVRALVATPGTEEARQLEMLDREVSEGVVLTHEMLADIHRDISEHSQYTADQSEAIDLLAAAVTAGGSRSDAAVPAPASVAPSAAPATAAEPPRAPPERGAARRPFATIRFDKPDVDYEPTLRQAVQRALRQRPDLNLEVVGVSPAADGPTVTASALGHARTVMRSLAEMGLPLDRLSMSGTTRADAASDEVRIFVR
ncbi:MAG TPA: hypothetical protein VF274_07225 [Alphaproteobacteria bacterium]